MGPSEREWMTRFLSHLNFERRLSSHTVSAYRHDLLTLLAFCERRDVKRWAALNNFQVRASGACRRRGPFTNTSCAKAP
jgi:integrase/recombinase XerC